MYSIILHWICHYFSNWTKSANLHHYFLSCLVEDLSKLARQDGRHKNHLTHNYHNYQVVSESRAMSEFISGWVGGCCGLLIGHPFDTLKVRQQALNQSSISVTIRNCVHQVKYDPAINFSLGFPILDNFFLVAPQSTYEKEDNIICPSHCNDIASFIATHKNLLL